MSDETVINSSVAEIADATISRLIAAGLIDPNKKGKQTRINWERILAHEYTEKFYPEIPHWYRIEVGAIPGDGSDPIYAKTRRWADCVLRMPDHMLILEFKMKAEPSVVSQLEHYQFLLPETPLFKKYRELPVKIKVVAAMIDGNARDFIASRGIEVEMYKPTNFDQWYKQTILKEK